MSDYEKINANVKAQVATRRKEAIKKIIFVLVAVLSALCGFAILQGIGFISITFAVILVAIAVCVGAFKTGYIWHDIKF